MVLISNLLWRTVAVISLLCVNCISAFLYPICFGKAENCFIDLSDFFSISNIFDTVPEEIAVIVEEPPIKLEYSLMDEILNVANEIFAPTLEYYGEHVAPFLKKVRYFPDLGETQKKMESKENYFQILLLVIISFYIVIYLYLSKKLCTCYVKTVKGKYATNLERFLSENK